jgi:hypothetical protein
MKDSRGTKLVARARALARVMNPASNSAEQERITAAAALDKMWPSILACLASAPPRKPLQLAEDEWCSRFTAAHDVASMRRFLRSGLTLDDLVEAMDITAEKKIPEDAAFRYFCGICWRLIKGDT